MVTIDEVGQIADTCDNFVAASVLKVPPKIHIECLVEGLKEISKKIKEYVVQEMGDNPWE